MSKPHKLFFSLTLGIFLIISTFIAYQAAQSRKVLKSKATEPNCSQATRPNECQAPCQWVGERDGSCIGDAAPTVPPPDNGTNCAAATRPAECPSPACQWVGDRNGTCQAVAQQPTIPPGTSGGAGNLTAQSVAYIGCSNSWQSVEGYHMVQNKGLFWPVDRVKYDIGGLTVEGWSRGGNWSGFDQMKAQFGNPKAVWVSMCVLEQESKRQTTTIDTVTTVINKVKEHAPGAAIYISSINSYVAPDYCTKVGRNGQAYIDGLRDEAVSRGLAQRGPLLGPLPSSMKIDGCHPNQDGQRLLGQDLVDFFDNLSVSGVTPPPAGITTQPTSTPEPDSNTSGQAVNLAVLMKLNFQGIMRSVGTLSSDKMNVVVTLVKGSFRQSKTVEFRCCENPSSPNGPSWTSTANFENVPGGSGYYLLVKGPKHVQKRVCELSPTETRPGTYSCFQGGITTQSGGMTADLSEIKLLVGDLPVQDGIVDSYDAALVRTILAKSLDERRAAENTGVADLNLDGVVDSQDFSLVIASLSVRSDER